MIPPFCGYLHFTFLHRHSTLSHLLRDIYQHHLITMGEPHPAFPSAEAPSSSRSSSALLTPNDLQKLLTQEKPLVGVKQKIIPALERLASQNEDAAEAILYQEKLNIEERTDEQLANATVPLVYVLYVHVILCWTVLMG